MTIADERRCGACIHWEHKKKRNCSNPETPLYYAECMFPLSDLAIPHCVSFEETSENNGTGCPCFAPMSITTINAETQ